MTGISVVIPCWNLGRVIIDALESVERQTRPATELIVVDDGSDDPLTRRVLADVPASRCRVVRTGNRGVAAARNLGIALTHAPYVVLLDADDVLEDRYLERLAGVLDRDADADFVTCGVQAFGEADYVWVPPSCSWTQTLARGGPHVSSMFRRGVWTSVGGFDARLAGYEDLDFWLKAIERGLKGVVLPEPLLRYRVRSASRYRRAIASDAYVETMARIYDAHDGAVQLHGPDLLLEKESFLAEQLAHRSLLAARQSEIERETSAVREQIGAALAAGGRSSLDWGELRRTRPISSVWGLDRGQPVDRYYIEQFLEQHQADIQGRVLEVKDPWYATRFGGSRVARADVIDVDTRNAAATIVADLSNPEPVGPSDAFDCFILTQTLHIIYDTRGALANAYRMLKPGGVLLCTVPCVSRVSYEDGGLDDGDFWRFTEASIRRALSDVFPPESVDVTSHGNVKTCAAFLLGLASQEMSAADLDARDPWFPLICCARAVKPVDGAPAVRRGVHAEPGAILLYHRISANRPDPHGLCVEPVAFRAHLEHLRTCYRPLPLDELVAKAAEGTPPAGAVALTFDDGYLDNLTVASNLLVEFGIPATFFVNSDRLDVEHECWWDVLARVLLSGADLPSSLDIFGDGRSVRTVETAADRAAVHQSLLEILYPLPAADRTAIVDRVCVWSGMTLTPRDTHRIMTADELARLAGKPGHSIGAHTVNHLCLPLQPADVQRREIEDGVRQLQDVLGRAVPAFAYPYGEHCSSTVRAVRSAGITLAVTVDGCLAGSATRALLSPRIEVSGSGQSTFASMLGEHFDRARRQSAAEDVID